jgi:signal transduction histidine kinase/ligand-binding sensor domain-containing protein
MLKCWLLCLLVVSGTSTAQDLRYLSHQAWGTEEGLPQSSVHAIAQTPDGYLWVATEGGLARFDGVGFKVYGRKNEAAFASDDLCCMKVQADGSLLIGTADGTVRQVGDRFERVADPLVEPSQGSVPEWAAKAIGSAARIQTVLIDREGFAWVGTRNGLQVVEPTTGTTQEVASLKGDSVLALFEDAEGNHWVGTETSGLHVLRRLKFRSEAGLANLAITSVVQASDGAMWVGTRDDGVRRVWHGVVSEPVSAQKLTSAVVLSLAPAADGAVWVGTPDGLNRVSPSGMVSKITSADGLPDDYVRALATGFDGEVWVGTGHGLALVERGRVKRVLTSAHGLAGDVVGALFFGRATGSPDLMKYLRVGSSGGTSEVVEGKVVPVALEWEPTRGKAVGALAQDLATNIWAVTSDGLLWRAESFPKGGIAANLSSLGQVIALAADRLGGMWIRLSRGLVRVPVSELDACVAKGGCLIGELKIDRYGRPDGLPNEEATSGAMGGVWLAKDGELWFPTRRGVAVVDTEHLAVDRVAPPVVVERFLVDDAEAENGAAIPFGNQRLTLEYAGLSFTAPAEVRYRVMLEGFDKGWVDVGSRRTATYTNLAPGPYRFRVQAANGDGVWNEQGAQIRFRVIPPFWRRWWFIAAVALAVLALVAAGIWLRGRTVRQEYEAVLAERNRMAREIHDTLTQDFVGASLQLDIVAQQLKRGKVESALSQVVRTRQLVSEGLEEARRSIWELRDGGSGDGLPVRLRRALQRITPAEGAAVKVQVGGAYRVLEPQVERELLRVAQEATTNAVRHSGAEEILVDLHYSDEAVMLRIEDNGAGFKMEEAAAKTGHYGLVGMRERAAEIGAELEVSSEIGAGTKVRLRLVA